MPYTFPDDIEEEIFINICDFRRGCTKNSKTKRGFGRYTEYIIMKDGFVYKNENMPGTNTHYADAGEHICQEDQLSYLYTMDAGMQGNMRVMVLKEYMDAFPKYVKDLFEKGKTHIYSPYYVSSLGVHYKEQWCKLDFEIKK
tara:strand:+ start:353 stop:778 length:426 start_codon:yes stop_codon:yes gene_type:complete